MSGDAIVDRVVSRVHVTNAASGLSPEAVRSIVEALLPAVEEMLAHRQQVRCETKTSNGYLDRIDRGGEA